MALVREGRAGAMLKGSLHTDEMLAAVVARVGGLRTERRISHCFILDVPLYHKPLVVTDAAINIEPDLETKADIARNAIDLCIALGIERPKLAVLAAVEVVTPKQPATIDAAALSKMADAARSRAASSMARWPSTMRSASRPRRQAPDQPGRRRSGYPAGPRPQVRQHAGQAAAVPGGGRERRRGGRRPGADRADQPGRGRPARLASCAVMKLATAMRVTKHGDD